MLPSHLTGRATEKVLIQGQLMTSEGSDSTFPASVCPQSWFMGSPHLVTASLGPKDKNNIVRFIVRLWLCCSASLSWSDFTLRDIWEGLRWFFGCYSGEVPLVGDWWRPEMLFTIFQCMEQLLPSPSQELI